MPHQFHRSGNETGLGNHMMAMGTYNLAALRLLFDAEPEECLDCEVHAYTDRVLDASPIPPFGKRNWARKS
jgi:hypothetical protein